MAGLNTERAARLVTELGSVLGMAPSLLLSKLLGELPMPEVEGIAREINAGRAMYEILAPALGGQLVGTCQGWAIPYVERNWKFVPRYEFRRAPLPDEAGVRMIVTDAEKAYADYRESAAAARAEYADEYITHEAATLLRERTDALLAAWEEAYPREAALLIAGNWASRI